LLLRGLMASPFVVSRVGLQRFIIRYKHHYAAECLGDDPQQIKLTLTLLGLDARDARLQGELRAALELFLFREKRAEKKFGKAKEFRIWKIDAKMLQVDFGGGHTELKSGATSMQALKRCLDELGANDLMLPDLKRELAAFRKDERPEPLADVLFFRDEGKLKVLLDARVHVLTRDHDAAVLQLAKQLKSFAPDRLLASYHAFQRGEKRIRAALGRMPR
jgi:hypothetical protein